MFPIRFSRADILALDPGDIPQAVPFRTRVSARMKWVGTRYTREYTWGLPFSKVDVASPRARRPASTHPSAVFRCALLVPRQAQRTPQCEHQQ